MFVGNISASGYNICCKKLAQKGQLYRLSQTELYHLHFNVHTNKASDITFYRYIFILIYLFTAIGLTPGGSSTVHIYTQTIQRTTQWNKIYRTENTYQ